MQDKGNGDGKTWLRYLREGRIRKLQGGADFALEENKDDSTECSNDANLIVRSYNRELAPR